MGQFDLYALRLPQARSDPVASETGEAAPRKCRGNRFLKGPVPWDWLCGAAALPGKALAVGIAFYHLSGLNRGAVRVQLSGKLLRELGVSRTSGYRALAALERRGLVVVERHPGRLPWVTLRDAGSDDV